MYAFPPIRTHPSVSLPPATALKHLQSYLAATQKNPYLLPNAILQPDGPRAHSESAASLVIHNLKRVEAGLRGEWLAPSLDLEAAAAGEFGDARMGVGVIGVDGVAGQAAEVEETEGWQDLDEYRREQSIEVGDGELREKRIGQEVGEAVVETMEVELLDEGVRKALDKEERKKRKLEKRIQERKDRHKKLPESK